MKKKFSVLHPVQIQHTTENSHFTRLDVKGDFLGKVRFN